MLSTVTKADGLGVVARERDIAKSMINLSVDGRQSERRTCTV